VAILQKRIGFFYDDKDEPGGFIVWGFLEEDTYRDACSSLNLPDLHPSEWNAGTYFCVLTFSAQTSVRYSMLRKLMSQRTTSFSKAYVRRKSKTREYILVELLEHPLQTLPHAARRWQRALKVKKDNELNSQQDHADHRFSFTAVELESFDIFRSFKHLAKSKENDLHLEDLSPELWIGVAALLSLRNNQLSVSTVGEFIATIMDHLKKKTIKFYFTNAGQPDSLIAWQCVSHNEFEANNSETEKSNTYATSIKMLITSRGLNKELREALRKDLIALPQPVSYSRQHRGSSVTRSFDLKERFNTTVGRI
jgi:hemolysin-activating ACP:hemolysin acyltransferase